MKNADFFRSMCYHRISPGLVQFEAGTVGCSVSPPCWVHGCQRMWHLRQAAKRIENACARHAEHVKSKYISKLGRAGGRAVGRSGGQTVGTMLCIYK